MGKALRRGAEDGGVGRPAAERLTTRALRRVASRAARALAVVALLAAPGRAARAQDDAPFRLDSGRFTVVAYPQDAPLARSLLRASLASDTFPGLPRPRERVLLAIAPDARRFRQWTGPNAPEWGAAIAFPESHRIVMQGRRAGSDAGDPLVVVRHEVAHLALHEAIGDLPPRWFDEGYASWAAGEWTRDETLEANLSLALRGMPSLDELEDGFAHGAGEAEASYALAYRAVAELSALDPDRGLTLFFQYWKETGKFDTAVRRAYGMTAAAFEKRWQDHTRRRYGALALFADLTVTSLLFLAILLPLYVIRRRRDRRRMEALIRSDLEAERRAREQRILEELLAATAGGAATPGDPERPDNAQRGGE